MSEAKSSLADKAGVVVFSRVVTTVIDLALVIALINLMQKSEFAIISFLLIVYETARYVATLGYPDSVFYFFERIGKSAKRAFALQTSAILALTGIVSFGIIMLASWFPHVYLSEWDIGDIEQIAHLLPYMAIVALLEIPTWPVQNIMIAADRQKDSAWYQLFNSTMTFAALVVPIALGLGLEMALQALVVYAIVRLVISIWWVLTKLPEGRLFFDSKLARNQFNFSLPIGLSMLASRFNRYIDKFVVSLLLPATALAEYTVGAQEVPIIKVIPFAVGSVLISRFVSLQIQEKKDELLALWHKGIQKVSLVVLPLTVMFILIAYDFIIAIAGDEYLASVLIFQIYTLIVLMRVTHYGSILQAFGDSKGILYLSLNLLAANLVLSIPLTYYFGITGTAIGTFVANMYNWHITLRRIGKHMNIKARHVLPFSYYLKVLGTAAAVAVPLWVIRNYLWAFDYSLFNLLWMIPVFLLLFFLAGILTNVISQTDRKQFFDWLRLKFL